MKIKNILVSQNAPEDIERSPYAELIRKYSINVDFYKFFKINCTTALDFRKTHINILDYESIVFSSTNTIDKFFELCKELRVEMPESMKYFCATESIALYLQKYVPYRKRRVFAAKDARVSSFYELLIKNKEISMLIPCSQDGIPSQLEQVLVVLFAIWVYRLLKINSMNGHRFHFFLYFCTLEFLPWLVGLKVLLII